MHYEEEEEESLRPALQFKESFSSKL